VAAFDTLAVKNKYFVRPIQLEDNNPRVYGLVTPNATERILELAYNADAEAGNLVAAPVRDKDKYVIALLANVRAKGEPTFADVRERMKKRDHRR